MQERASTDLDLKPELPYNKHVFDIDTTRTVTILRPKELAPSDLLSDEIEEALAEFEERDIRSDYSEMRDREVMDESIERIKELMCDIAESLNLRLNMYEYNVTNNTQIPSRAARKWIGRTNMITAFEPTDEQLSYITGCIRENPVMSALIGWRNPDYVFSGSNLEIMDTKTIPIIQKSSITKCPRFFVSRVQYNDEDVMKPHIRGALAFPNIIIPPTSRPT